MKRFRIKGQSVVSSFDRQETTFILEDLNKQGFLEVGASEMQSVILKRRDGQRVKAHISPQEVSLVAVPAMGL